MSIKKYQSDFLKVAEHYTEKHVNTGKIKNHLSKQITAIELMIDAFTPDEIITHIFSNKTMYHVNEFTSMKYRAAMYMVIRENQT